MSHAYRANLLQWHLQGGSRQHRKNRPINIRAPKSVSMTNSLRALAATPQKEQWAPLVGNTDEYERARAGVCRMPGEKVPQVSPPAGTETCEKFEKSCQHDRMGGGQGEYRLRCSRQHKRLAGHPAPLCNHHKHDRTYHGLRRRRISLH